MKKPLLSAIICNYNHAHYIHDALEGILNQTYEPMEVIVIDDGSTDNSVEVINSFAAKYPGKMLFERNETNRGGLYSTDKAVDISTGEYLYFGAADDKVLPGFFQKTMEQLIRHPEAGLCCTDPVYFDDKGNRRTISLSWLNKAGYLEPNAIACALNGGFIFGHTSIYSKAIFQRIGGFIHELKWHGDWFGSLVMAFRYGICYVPEPLAAMREGYATYSSSGMRDWQQQKEVLLNILRIIKSPSYRDVLPYFIHSSVMAHFGDEIVRTVMESPEHWDTETLMLIKSPLFSNWKKNLK